MQSTIDIIERTNKTIHSLKAAMLQSKSEIDFERLVGKSNEKMYSRLLVTYIRWILYDLNDRYDVFIEAEKDFPIIRNDSHKIHTY